MFLLNATSCQVGTRNPLVSSLELQSTPKTIKDIVVAIACSQEVLILEDILPLRQRTQRIQEVFKLNTLCLRASFHGTRMCNASYQGTATNNSSNQL